MRYVFAVAILLCFSDVMFAQKGQAPPPDYLINKPLPDSVTQMLLQNLDGEMVSLESVLDKHSGKKIVIDVWASWCRDCIVSLPDLNKLMTSTKDMAVDYVFISVDKENAKWKNAIDRFQIEGDHYRTVKGWKSPFSNYIVLDWIPRYMVIDEEGMVVLPKTVKASDTNIKKILTQ